MKVYLEPDDLDVRIEIVPLIDVIFCILVFFILGAVNYARLQGLNIDLPQAETAKAQFSDTLPVEVDALGQLKVENTPVTEEQLSQILAAYVKQKPQGVVVVNADKLVSYGQVASLIDTLQKVGGTRVALGASAQTQVPTNSDGLNPNPTLPGPLTPIPDLTQPTQPGLPTLPPTGPGATQTPDLLQQPNLSGTESPASQTVPIIPTQP